VDVALTGVRGPQFVEISSAILEDTASRINLAQLHERTVR
jgi:hypothetical protein